MKINRAFQSTRTIKCKFTFWLLCLVSAFSAPRTAFGLNQTIAGKNYYHNAAWVPTYISKQYGGMVCISEVQVSLDENGKAQLKASLLLTSQPVIDANFKVII